MEFWKDNLLNVGLINARKKIVSQLDFFNFVHHLMYWTIIVQFDFYVNIILRLCYLF